MIPIEVRRGRDGELFAVGTKLGWTVLCPLKDSAPNLGNNVSEVVERTGNTRLEDISFGE